MRYQTYETTHNKAPVLTVVSSIQVIEKNESFDAYVNGIKTNTQIKRSDYPSYDEYALAVASWFGFNGEVKLKTLN